MSLFYYPFFFFSPSFFLEDNNTVVQKLHFVIHLSMNIPLPLKMIYCYFFFQRHLNLHKCYIFRYRTSKYSFFTFPLLNLFEQFRKGANAFFLVICYPIVSYFLPLKASAAYMTFLTRFWEFREGRSILNRGRIVPPLQFYHKVVGRPVPTR